MEQAHRNVHQQSVETSPYHPSATTRGRSTTGPTPHPLRSSSLCPRILLRYLVQQSAKIHWKYVSKNIGMVQKRALRIILPGTSYSEALAKLNCPRLDARRIFLCQKTMRNIESGGYLSRHLPQTRESSHKYDLRNKSNLSTFNCRTNRFQKSFFFQAWPLF